MSTLSSIDGKLGREEPQYRKSTLALIALRAQSHGYATKIGLQEDKLEESCKNLFDFVTRLQEALDQEVPKIDLRPFLRRMKDGKKPMQDWRISCPASAERRGDRSDSFSI